MAIDDFSGEPVTGGSWLYDGTARQRIFVVACNFDRQHVWALEEVEHVREDHGEEIDDPAPPRPMGPDGVLYHLQGATSPDFDTVAEAKAWVDLQPWGPVEWDD